MSAPEDPAEKPVTPGFKAELGGEPDTEIVKQAGRTLWNIIQGAIGSLLAMGATQPEVWHVQTDPRGILAMNRA